MGKLLSVLVITCLVLPAAIVVDLAAARLLGAMQDDAGARVLDRFALGGGILWAILLVLLLFALGINALGAPGERPRAREEE